MFKICKFLNIGQNISIHQIVGLHLDRPYQYVANNLYPY